jgi:hypothetical protein
MKKRIAALAIAASAGATPVVAGAAPAGAAPADGRCVAKGAGATFDGPTKAAVAKGGLMSFVILDHAFNGADATESLLGITICT